MLEDMWETVTDYNAHAKANNCILFIKDIHFSIFCHETITGLRLLAPTVYKLELFTLYNRKTIEATAVMKVILNLGFI